MLTNPSISVNSHHLSGTSAFFSSPSSTMRKGKNVEI